MWALIASLYIGNVMLLVLNLPLVGMWVKLLKIPKTYLLGHPHLRHRRRHHGMRQSAFDLVLLYAIGLLGVVMRRFEFPTAPVVVGMILGRWPGADAQRAVDRRGPVGVFVDRPVSVFLLLVVVAVLVLPRLMRLRNRWKKA